MTNKLYRSRKGKILGLCQGIADWRDIPVSYIRWGVILVALFTTGIPVVLIYIVTSFILDLAPPTNEEYQEGYYQGRKESYDKSKGEFNSTKGDFNNKEKDWESRFNDSK